jgi:DNA (cytosine-5)-methyltransferase 1
MDMGFEEAGFDISWTNELNPSFADMYGFGVSAWRAAEGRMPAQAQVSCRESIESLAAHGVMAEAFPCGAPEVFGVIGGPPCTDFSIGGLHEGSTGEHGRLTWTFVHLICALKPTFFVIENVPGLCRTKKHRGFLCSQVQKLEAAGYAVDYKVLNALELGIPQDRHRLFVVGFEQGLAEERLNRPLITGARDWFQWPADPRYAGAKSLPWPRTSPFGHTPQPPALIPLDLTVYACLAGPPDPRALPNGEDTFVPYSARFQEIPEGDVQGKSFKRLHRYRYSPTAWYGNNEVHLHPWEPRRLSVREALRIQTVPDSYALPAELPLQSKFKLIGNGVPCRLAKHVASAVRRFIQPDACTAARVYNGRHAAGEGSPAVLPALVPGQQARLSVAGA